MLFGMEILGGLTPFAGGSIGGEAPFEPIGWVELCPVSAIWGNQTGGINDWQNVNKVASSWVETDTTEQPFTRCE